jgi:hypothetical protein
VAQIIRYFTLLLSLVSFHCVVHCHTSAVTFERNSGRFGDDLISCSQAYWVHYRYNLPLLLTPFHYSEHLHIQYDHESYTKDLFKEFKRTIYVKTGLPVDYTADSTLYITTFREQPDVDWSDEDFVDAFRRALSPIYPNWRYMRLSHASHSIALHVRRGGSFSYDKHHYTQIPLQFPSLNYYVQALKLLLLHLNGPCHVHLFTDDPKPKPLAKKIKKQLSPIDQARVTITYRTKGNSHKAYVLTDFFDMMQFKYLIRPCSHFSLFVEQLGTCSVSMYPKQALHRKKHWGTITAINVTTFTNKQSETVEVPLNHYGQETYTNLIPLLQTPEMQEILLHPEQRALERKLQPMLPPCY